MYSLPPPPPTNPTRRRRPDFTAALIRRRRAAVALLLTLSVAVALLAVVSFVKLLPVRGDASHTAAALRTVGALDRALQRGSDAVENRTRLPKEARAAWEDVLRFAREAAAVEPDDPDEARAARTFKEELDKAAPNLTEAMNFIAQADPALETGARQRADVGMKLVSAAAREYESTLARQLDEQMGAARWWLAVCLGLVLLTGVMMAVTVLTWAYADYADRQRARALGGAAVGEEALEAAKRLSLAIDNGPLAVVEWSADFICTRWSGRAAEMFGRSAEEVIGKPWDRLKGHIHPDDAERVRREIAPLLDGRAACVVIRHRNLRKDGTVLHCVWYNSALQDGAGKPRAFLSLADDVTRDVEVEAAYHAEAELVGRIAEAAPMGISVSGADGSLLFANRFIMDLFGISKEDTAAGRGALKEFKLLELDGTPIPDAERPSSIALRTGRPVVGRQVRVVSPFKPETVTVSVTAVPLKAKSGAVDAVLIVHEDINERITADAEREAMAEELSRARRIEAVGNLAGGIAHDFGNVLLAISYAADALAGSASAQQPTAEHAAQLRHAIGVARQLTDSLVNYASGRDTTRRPLHLCNFLTVNCKFIARLLPHNFKVVCTPPPDPDRPVIVNASGPQLLQVLMNLAVNARDAMPMGGTLRLDLKVDRSGNAPTAVLEVSDTGQGMTPEVSRRAFERFYTTKSPGEGTGIGLPTVRHIVHEHGGTIDLHTAPGQGTRVVIRLPVVQDAPTQTTPAALAPSATGASDPSALPRATALSPRAAAAAAARAAELGAASAAPSGSSAAVPPAPAGATPANRALVVESDERVRPLIVQALRNAGFHVESFTTCAAAASVFERNPAGWAVALLEFSTTEDAPGCAHVLRRTTPTLPVLLLTSNPADASGNFADAHTRVLLKPFTVGSLRSALSDLLKQPAPR